MKILNDGIKISTKGNPDLIDITGRVENILSESKLKKGIITVFVVGSTAAITTFEYEPGLVKDIRGLFEKLIPSNKRCAHDEAWGDPECSGLSGDFSGYRSSAAENRGIPHANGFSHLRARCRALP
jgi:thiamine phosphate synthase YjbQ (UPF0047 family)